MTWESIETASKDGQKILLGRFAKGCREGKYGFMAIDKWHTPTNGIGWIGWSKFNPELWPPTHWQPLPEPPNK